MATLKGMKAICTHMNRSDATVLGWIRDLGFPAVKVGLIYEADTEAIRKWKVEHFSPAKKKAREGSPGRW